MKSKKKFLVVFFAVIAVLVLAVVAMIVFLRVDKISSNIASRYSQTDIINASGVSVGDSMVLLSTSQIEEEILSKCLYIETVNVTKKFPFDLEIEVVGVEERFSLLIDTRYRVISKYGKILDTSDTPLENTAVLIAGEADTSSERLQFEDEQTDKVFNEIVLALEDIDNISKIDISDIYNIEIIYDDRIIMEIGDYSDLTYKINFGIELVTSGQISEVESGVLDLSLSKSHNKTYFEAMEIVVDIPSTESSQPEESSGELSSDIRQEESSTAENESSEPQESSTFERGDDIPDF